MIFGSAHTHIAFWELVAALVGPISGILGFIWRAMKKRFDNISFELDVQNKAKLEWEKSVEAKHTELSVKVARLEGPSKAIARVLTGEENPH